MGNYLLSVAGLSAAGSLFMYGDGREAATWAYLAVAALMCVVVAREFAKGVFGPAFSARRSARGR